MIKLLAVDDEPGLCKILEKTFNPIGFKVLTANNAKDALVKVKKDKPQLVFLDVRMPDMSGFDVLKEIKNINPKIIVVMLTVFDDEISRKKAKELGADDFIGKPFIPDELAEFVRLKVARIVDKESEKHA